MSGFAGLSPAEIDTHMLIARYHRFTLTDAIRPAYDVPIKPLCGFKHQTVNGRPGLLAAITREALIDLFFDLLSTLGDTVTVTLQSSHEQTIEFGMVRHDIDLPVLKSILADYEDILLDDGCFGITVSNGKSTIELDDHKLISACGGLSSIESVLVHHYVDCDESLKFIHEAEHVHQSNELYFDRISYLSYDLGM